MLEYQQTKLAQSKRKKVLMLTYIISIAIHMLIFFTFNFNFVSFKEVKITRIVKVKRINLPRGNRPGPLSASAARKRGMPKPNMAPQNAKPIKRRVSSYHPPINSSIKIPSKQKEKDKEAPKPDKETTEIMLDQKESEVDVLSMIGDGEVIPGGGNMGTDENAAYGFVYDNQTEYEYSPEGSDKGAKEGDFVAAAAQPDKYLGTMATPVVESIPHTSISQTFTDIPYPETVKIKKEKLASGICRVYLRLDINSSGDIKNIYIRSPKTKEDQQRYGIFLDTVLETVKTWKFENRAATVFVDVRFAIE